MQRDEKYVDIKIQQDRQCSYHVTLRRIHGTIAAVEKEYYIFSLSLSVWVRACVCVCGGGSTTSFYVAS
jgi:hypothetical protein